MSRYQGSELDLFALATRWKAYVADRVRPYLRGAVLEVGAGLGANTAVLAPAASGPWLCLEPDPALAARILATRDAGGLPSRVEVRAATSGSLDAAARFDTILYFDVLEHIEDDAAELASVVRHLDPGGHLVVLGPAHPWLYSPFDRAIGHFRRYTRASLAAVVPPGLGRVELAYLDSVGLAASAANRLLLRQTDPTPAQIALWDRWMVPLSRCIDPLIGGRAGKSVLGVWRG